MEVRPPLQIQTIIKAMMEDVIPALEPGNQLALQSAQLTIGTLHLIAQHLDLQYRYDCDELARLRDAAEKLSGEASGGSRTETALAELREASSVGDDVLDRARAEPTEILAAVHRLRAAAAAIVRAVYADGSEVAQAAVGATVLAMSKEQLLRDRSWLLMQGWEPDPKAVPTIETLLSPLRRS